MAALAAIAEPKKVVPFKVIDGKLSFDFSVGVVLNVWRLRKAYYDCCCALKTSTFSKL